MRFRPCIDLYRGKVAQIVGSTLRDGGEGTVTNYRAGRPPSYFARGYRDDRLYGGHVIMLGEGNRDGAFEALDAFPGGLQVGGGITPDNASVFLDRGASHVIVTSFVFREGRVDRERLDAMRSSVGRQRLVLDLSCKRVDDSYVIATDRWQRLSEVRLDEATFEDLARFCDEFLVHAAHVEGKREGIDEPLVELLARCSPLSVTYAGGIRDMADLELIKDRGRGRVDFTVGSALDIFGGSLAYRDVVAWHRQNAGEKGASDEKR